MLTMSRTILGVFLSLVAVGLCENVARGWHSPTTYGTITTSVNGSVLRATISNPPINVYDNKLSVDLFSLVNSLKNQTEIKVVILASANPDFWIAHYDIHLINAQDPPPPPVNMTEVGTRLLSTAYSIATLPVIFIAEIDGRVTGAGDELALRFDIRYAGPGARLSQFEVGFNILPGAGGLQYLVKLIGRARALEYILSGRSVDAETAASIGWVNQAFSSPEQLRLEVDALAHQIASFSSQALAAIKQRINASSNPSTQSIAEDNSAFFELSSLAVSQAASARYLELSENQGGNAFELAIPANLEALNG
ncbi:hypothetical protein MMC22_007280 [Lobaria immixta]|nr:hypothetical protein [Lobaria immixta]